MKKDRILSLSVLLILAVSLMVLAGCQPAATPTVPPTAAPTATPTTAPTEVPVVDYGENLTYKGKLLYLIWGGDGDVAQETAKAQLFMDKYPDITVEITYQNGAWPDILAARQADGTFPDLFWNPDVHTFIVSDYVADLSIFQDDVEYVNWNSALMAMANYGGMQAAVPNKYFTSGVYINKDMLEQNNIDIPELDWSYEDMTNIIKDLAATGGDLRGCGWPIWNGLFTTPSGMYRNIRDGKDFDFGDPENIKLHEFRFEQFKYSNDYLKDVDGKDYWFESGKVGMIDDMSWGVGWLAKGVNDGQGLLFDWDYYPLPSLEPGGQQYQLAVADFISVANIAMSDGDRAVSDTEKEKLAAAYVLLRYLCLNEEGYLAAMDLGFNSLPVFESETATAAFLEEYGIADKPGFKKVLDMMNDPEVMIVEPNKFIPGVGSAVWDQYFNLVLTNEMMAKADYVANIQQKAADMNAQAKTVIADASTALKQTLKDNYGIDWSPSE